MNAIRAFCRTPLGALLQIAAVAACVLVQPTTSLWLPLQMATVALLCFYLAGDWQTTLLFEPPTGPNWRWLAESTLAGLLTGLLVAGVIQPLLHRLLNQPAPTPGLAAGDNGLLVAGLLIAWLSNALGKGLVYRCFLLSRLEQIFGVERAGQGAAIVLGAAALGLSAWHQGPVGILSAGAAGLGLNLFFYWSRRNFWPAFVAHGLYNSTLIGLAFLGRL